MTSRLAIAKARAAEASAALTATPIGDDVRRTAGRSFADADDAVRIPKRVLQDPPSRERRLGFSASCLHADGFDFGPRYDPPARVRLANVENDDTATERFLLHHGGWTREEYDDAVAAVARGELADL